MPLKRRGAAAQQIPNVTSVHGYDRAGSEVSDLEAAWQIVTQPPPKSKMCSGRTLVFPMDRKAPNLPKYEGPRMQPFRRSAVEVQFIRELGTNAMHSNVFEVLIDSRPYALKLFRTFSSAYIPPISDWEDGSRYMDARKIWHYYKPFNCECRAYARIKERKIEDRFWKCYGYVRLPAELRQQLYDITGLPAFYWQVRHFPMDQSRKPTTTYREHLSWPIYGLVKELAPFGAPPIDPKIRSIALMHSDIKSLHKADIANDDIDERNYVAGRLVDFSHSLTLPHISAPPPEVKPQKRKVGALAEYQNHDYLLWQYLILDSGVKTRVVQKDFESPVHTRLRKHRQICIKGNRPVEPFYELGVREPTPPRERRADSYDSTSS